MADYSGYNPFEYLTGRQTTRKKTPTYGAIAPVTRPQNPYYPVPTSSRPQSPSVTQGLLGLLAQQKSQKTIPSASLAPNYDSDPILAQIRALGSQTNANAESNAAALRKKAVIDAGITTGNLGVDTSTIQAAGQNQGSALATFQYQAEQRLRELEDALNSNNLFYSGYRQNSLSDLARSRALGESEIGNSLFGSLSEIDSQLAQSRAAQVAQEQAALAEAAANAQQQAYIQSLMDALAAANAPPAPTTPQQVAQEAAPYAPGYEGPGGQQVNPTTPQAISDAYQVPITDVMGEIFGGGIQPQPTVEEQLGVPPGTLDTLPPEQMGVISAGGGNPLIQQLGAVDPGNITPFPGTEVVNSSYSNIPLPPENVNTYTGPMIGDPNFNLSPEVAAAAQVPEHIPSIQEVLAGAPDPYVPEPTPVDPYAGMTYWPGYGWMPVGWNPPPSIGPGYN